MKLAAKIGIILAVLLFALLIAVLVIARNQALNLVYHPLQERDAVEKTPADYALSYEALTVQSEDGYELHGWFIPSQNGAGVILQHGYKSDRVELLEEAAVLARHGYGVLLASTRAHDINEGELIAFGLNEMLDMDVWYDTFLRQESIEADRIGILGNSLGGTLAIQYAAMNTAVKAVVAHSAFSSMRDTINTSVSYFTDLPAFPFASFIRFWAELEIDGDMDDIDAKQWIGQISPRPILILHSLADIAISAESGELLFAAASEPKELWEVDGVEHASFDTALAEQFERRVVNFFNQYLLGGN